MRWLSGAKNVFSGNVTQGALKMGGYTKANMMRNIGLGLLITGAVLLAYFAKTETLLEGLYIPPDIRKMIKF